MFRWHNEDLLIEGQDQELFFQCFPKIYHYFNWPEMKELFQKYDKIANVAKRKALRYGLFAVSFGCFGLITMALVPVISIVSNGDVHITNTAGSFASLFAVLSTVACYSQFLNKKHKIDWLTCRMKTERIRQFHFQMLINNVHLAEKILKDKNFLREWLELRNYKFYQLCHELDRDLDILFNHVQRDIEEEDVWLRNEWREMQRSNLNNQAAENLIDAIKEMRIGVQKRYLEKKMLPGWASVTSRLQIVSVTSDCLTSIIVIITAIIGGLLGIGYPYASNIVTLGLSLIGVASAIVITLRIISVGFQLREEKERLEWYISSLNALDRRFSSSITEDKVLILRETERLAYAEMRRFICNFARTRFII